MVCDPYVYEGRIMTASELRKIWIVKDIDEKTVSINGYKGTESQLVIPDKIGTKTVTRIGFRAFRSASHKSKRKVYQAITSIELPDSVLHIDPEAFEGCKSLRSVRLSENIEYLIHYIFSDCVSLESIVIPAAVRKIEGGAFENCKALERCVLQSEKTTIVNNAFSKCTNLRELSVQKKGAVRPFEWRAPSGGLLPFEDINAFARCKKLKAVGINKTVKYIPEGFCSGCESLEKIELPEEIEDIGANAFRGCSSVKYLRIPSSVKHINSGAFAEMKSLKRVDIFSKTIKIDSHAFDDCPNLKIRYIDK